MRPIRKVIKFVFRPVKKLLIDPISARFDLLSDKDTNNSYIKIPKRMNHMAMKFKFRQKQVVSIDYHEGDYSRLVAPGIAIKSRWRDELPVVVLVCLGQGPDKLVQIVEEVLKLQIISSAFKPLFVVDSSDFTQFRKYELSFEFIPNETNYSASKPQESWTDFVEDRLSEIYQQYQPDLIVNATQWLSPTDIIKQKYSRGNVT